jgi:hypothetical protein
MTRVEPAAAGMGFTSGGDEVFTAALDFLVLNACSLGRHAAPFDLDL